MSNETKTAPIVVTVPKSLGLGQRELETLETKWETDLARATEGTGAKTKVKIKIKIVVKG